MTTREERRLSPRERELWNAAGDAIADGLGNEEAAARLVDAFAEGPEDVEDVYYAALAAIENLRAEQRRVYADDLLSYCDRGHPGYAGRYCGPCVDEDAARGDIR